MKTSKSEQLAKSVLDPIKEHSFLIDRKPPADQVFLAIKCSYGRFRAYPACDASRQMAMWIGKRTFSQEDVTIMEELGHMLGYTVHVTTPS